MTEFSCSCDFGDGYAEVDVMTRPRARKDHVCLECRQVIHQGEVYARRFIVFDGQAYTEKYCERCDDLMAAFSDVGFCWDVGEFLMAYANWLIEDGKSIPGWLCDLHNVYAEMEEDRISSVEDAK